MEAKARTHRQALETKLILSGNIPLDKSWIIRMGVLDLINGSDSTLRRLGAINPKELPDDLRALARASHDWLAGGPVHVGESGTLYRFLQFVSWKYKLGKTFVKEGTLREREICDNPDIVNWPIEKLGALDEGTSQWKSAAAIAGSLERQSNPEPKLQLTYEAIRHWEERKREGNAWLVRYDDTLIRQAVSFIQFIQTGKMEFEPLHAEDYCFARAFELITREEGQKRWKQLSEHESDRLEEMEAELKNFREGRRIMSKDHRVVQAIAMLAWAQGKKAEIAHPQCVSKSWPQFWGFMAQVSEFSKQNTFKEQAR